MHKVYVLDDQDPFEVPLAQYRRWRRRRAGIAVVGHDGLDVTGGAVFSGEVEKISESGAQAVFFAGGGGSGRGGAVAAAAQRRSAPVAVGVEQDGQANRSPLRSARRRPAPT